MLKKLILFLFFLASLGFAQSKQDFDLEENSLRKTNHDHLVYDYLTVTNDMLEGTLLKDGYFTLGTGTNGTSISPFDDNCQITYGHPFAKTSYPVVVIDGEEFQYSDLFDELNSITSLSSSRSLLAYNENAELAVSFQITVSDTSDQIILEQKIRNKSDESINIGSKILFDPALGKYGDGAIPLSGSFLQEETTFDYEDIFKPFTLFEKSSGNHGMEVSFEFDTNKPNTISAKNWLNEDQADLQITNLFDLLLEFTWDEVELATNDTLTSRVILSMLPPQFGDVFARLDIPNNIMLDNGLAFPKEFTSYLELYNNSSLNNFDVSIESEKPVLTSNDLFVDNSANGSIHFLPLSTNIQTIYEDVVAPVTIKIKNNNEVYETITKNIFVPSSPLSDEGLLIVDDSLAVSENNVDLFFQVQNEETGWPIGGLLDENIFLYQDGIRVNDFTLDKYLGGGSSLADIVFVLDCSGSMGNEINAVRDNLNSFGEDLLSKGFDFQIGVVTFSTTVDDVWDFTNDLDQIRDNLSSIQLWGGIEDSPSALMQASELSFRPGSRRSIIWITDEAYPEEIFTAENVVNRMLQMGITVHSVSDPELQTEWSNPITIPTGGDFFDINGNFLDILLTVSNMDSENIFQLSFESNADLNSTSNILLEIHYGSLGVKKNFTLNGTSAVVKTNALSFYPNPFNPEVNFNISHQNYSDGEINIYNILGQCVNTIPFTKANGSNLKWNAQNSINTQVSTGFYIVRLTLKSQGNIVHQESAKILYLK